MSVWFWGRDVATCITPWVAPEMARATILSGQRVRPGVLERTGFVFTHRSLPDALRSML